MVKNMIFILLRFCIFMYGLKYLHPGGRGGKVELNFVWGQRGKVENNSAWGQGGRRRNSFCMGARVAE